MTSAEADKKNAEILKKTQAFNYQGYTIDRIYNTRSDNQYQSSLNTEPRLSELEKIQ